MCVQCPSRVVDLAQCEDTELLDCGRSMACLGVGKRVFVLMHKSVMTVDKVLASRRKLRDFCKKVRESSEAPLVHLKGKQLCLVLATDYIPHW